MSSQTMPEHISIGTDKQLFIDDLFVETSDGLTFTMNPPAKGEPVLRAEGPVESGRIGLYCTVIEGDGEYLMYYQAIPSWGRVDVLDHMTCLATSSDGLTWHRESVNLYDVRGCRNNNVVLPGCTGTVFRDPHETEGCRYWWFGQTCESEYWNESNGAVRSPGLPHEGGQYLMKSTDGRVWKRADREPALPFWADTQNQCFYDDRLGMYVAYLRAWNPTIAAGVDARRRAVARTATDSLLDVPWPFTRNPERAAGARGLYGEVEEGEIPLVLQTDEDDPQPMDIYTPSVVKYPYAPAIYLAFPMMYRHYETSEQNPRDSRGSRRNSGPCDVELVVSRDGVTFSRFRRPYVGLGQFGEEDAGQVNIALGMTRSEGEIRQYYAGTPFTHGGYDRYQYGPGAGVIRSLSQRLDGFVSLDADHSGGELVTPTIVFEGSRLYLNVDCSATGEVWVEIQDRHGSPLEGFSLQDAVSVDRNGVEQEVWWKNGPDVGALAGTPVKLRFRMRSAKLYAFQFKPVGMSRAETSVVARDRDVRA